MIKSKVRLRFKASYRINFMVAVRITGMIRVGERVALGLWLEIGLRVRARSMVWFRPSAEA
jgi:hypothetical protein